MIQLQFCRKASEKCSDFADCQRAPNRKGSGLAKISSECPPLLSEKFDLKFFLMESAWKRPGVQFLTDKTLDFVKGSGNPETMEYPRDFWEQIEDWWSSFWCLFAAFWLSSLGFFLLSFLMTHEITRPRGRTQFFVVGFCKGHRERHQGARGGGIRERPCLLGGERLALL